MTRFEKKQRVIYYIDEFIVLLFSIIGVIFSEVVNKKAKGLVIDTGDIALDWLNVLISSLLAIIVYSTMNIQFVYNDRAKPPLIKRVANALLQGIAWQSIVGMAQ